MRVIVVVSAAVVVLMIGSSASATPISAATRYEVPESVGPAPIYVSRTADHPPAKGHTFSFDVSLNVCPGPLLEFDHATVIERPRIGNQRGVAIVTAYVRWRAHKELEAGEPCPPEVPTTEEVRVRTRRPASKLIFFDGSRSPPRRVFRPQG